MRPPQPYLLKTLFVANYAPYLDFYNNLFHACAKVPGYPDWRTNVLSVTLQDLDHYASATVAHNNIAFDHDFPDATTEQQHVQETFGTLPAGLGVKVWNRFGLRRWYVIPVTTEFDDLMKLVSVKFLSQNRGLKRILPYPVTDCLYRVFVGEDDDKATLTIGPVRRNEIKDYVPFNRQDHLKVQSAEADYQALIQRHPELAVYCEIDVYKAIEGLGSDELLPFYQEACQKCDRFADGVVTYLFSVDPEEQE